MAALTVINPVPNAVVGPILACNGTVNPAGSLVWVTATSILPYVPAKQVLVPSDGQGLWSCVIALEPLNFPGLTGVNFQLVYPIFNNFSVRVGDGKGNVAGIIQT